MVIYVHLLLLKEAFIYTFDSTLERDCAFAETVTPLSGFVRCSVRSFVPVARFGARVQHVRLFNEANEKAVS